ncbi:hypothetical protein OROHE_007688 [Orobanche hederae]
MPVKLSYLTLFRRIPNWVSRNAHLSSLSCEIKLQASQESDQIHSNPTDFEAKNQLLKNKLHPDSLASVLDTTSDLNSSTNLSKYAPLQKRFEHTAESYQMMILKLGMAGNLEEMEGFCNEMVMAKFRGFDKSLLALIHSFVSHHRLSEALRVLYVMNSSSVKPSIGISNALMGALVEGKRDFKDVLFVYKEMVKSGVGPNVDTLNYLLEALLESGRVDLAIDQYKRMEKKGCVPNIRTFQILVSGLAARNRLEESTFVLEEMFRFQCEPDSGFYSCIIPIFCSLNNPEIGLRLFKMMKASNIAPDSVTYVAMIKCLCEHYHLDDAILLFKEMINSGLLPDHRLCLDVVNALCKLNRLVEAEKFLEEQNIMDSCPHNALLEFYCDSRNFTTAKVMFDKMFERNITDSRSWNILIRFLCEEGAIHKALEYLSRMFISCSPPDSVTYSALILGNCKMGNIFRALDLFSHVRSNSWVLDSVTYSECVECLCKRENIQEAVQVFRYMSGQGCSLESTTFSVLIDGICATGEVNRAVNLLSLAYYYTGTASLGASAYASILRGLSKPGQENNVLVMFARMMIALGSAFDMETYCILVRCMSCLNRTGDCVYLLNLMISEGLVPDSQTLACLLSCLAKYSKLHLVLPFMVKLGTSKSETLDSSMYNLLIGGLWREGYRDEARRFLDLMLDKGWVPDASTHALLVMGSIGIDEAAGRKAKESSGGRDYVSCILEEGLGKNAIG